MVKIDSIHFVGIKGVGMSPLAIIAKEAGIKVTGSDVADVYITDSVLKQSSIIPEIGFSQKHIKNQQLVITTGAHGGFDNVEVKTAKGKKIPVLSQGEAVGKFMQGALLGRNYVGVSVAGCHGKTTSTAMIATILMKNNCDPSFLIGTGEIPYLKLPGHFGKGEYFVAEADEYATEPVYDKTPKLLWQKPTIILLTNIEFDHPDLFSSVDQIRSVFLSFANQLPNNGTLVLCGDDPENRKLLKEFKGKVKTYGFSSQNDFVIETVSNERTFSFRVRNKGIDLGEVHINVAGDHNALNALGSLIVCLELGLTITQIKKGLSVFRGTKRRFEYIGTLKSGALLFDDYAHHPTEIKKTLEAFKARFKQKRIICIFQPHTYSRTKYLFNEFSQSFSNSDQVILTDIYPSLRETEDKTVSSKELSLNIKRVHKSVLYLPNLTDVVKYIEEESPQEDSIVLTMGAGDVYKIAEKLEVIR